MNEETSPSSKVAAPKFVGTSPRAITRSSTSMARLKSRIAIELIRDAAGRFEPLIGRIDLEGADREVERAGGWSGRGIRDRVVQEERGIVPIAVGSSGDGEFQFIVGTSDGGRARNRRPAIAWWWRRPK